MNRETSATAHHRQSNNSKSAGHIFKYSSIAIMVIAAFIATVIIFNVHTEDPSTIAVIHIILITIAGPFGGLLYTVRDGGFEMPHKDPAKPNIWKPGWIADCLYGIAGAYVVFLVLPSEIAFPENSASHSINPAILFIKPFAIALVGGYGGKWVLDRALSNLMKQVKDAQKEAKKAQEKIIQREHYDSSALKLTELYLEGDEVSVSNDELKSVILKSSQKAKQEIFTKAQNLYKQGVKSGDKDLIRKPIPLFKALAETDSDEEQHRYHAHLGYIFKTSKEWQKGYEALTTAIELRDRAGKSGFLKYELYRAICAIKLDMDADVINKDIQRLQATPEGKNMIVAQDAENSIKKWQNSKRKTE